MSATPRTGGSLDVRGLEALGAAEQAGLNGGRRHLSARDRRLVREYGRENLYWYHGHYHVRGGGSD
ncbi:MAG: hypothetical protein ACAI25_06580 [Planctomycetota bacterium]